MSNLDGPPYYDNTLGDVAVPAAVAPLSTPPNGSFPSMRTSCIIGSPKLLSDITSRDNIPSGLRAEGMLAFVQTTGLTYQLQGGILNANWATLTVVAQTLAQVLAVGNVTGGTSIVVSSGDLIRGVDTGTGTALLLRGGTSSTVATAGATATLLGGSGNTSGDGGAALVTGGTPGTSGTGGAVTITSGAGGSVSGAAGGVSISTGTPVDGAAGAVSIVPANAVGTNRAGGAITATASNATGSAAGGSVSVTAGRSVTGTAGGVTITSGAGGSTSGASGTLALATGTPVEGNGGSITITGAAGVTATATARSGGSITLTAGNAVSGGTAGAIALAGTGAITTTTTGAGAITVTSATTLAQYASSGIYQGGTGVTNAMVLTGELALSNGVGFRLTNASAPSTAGLLQQGGQVTWTNTVATTVATVAMASGGRSSGKLFYEIDSTDGTDHQALSGQIAFTAVDKAGTLSTNLDTTLQTQAYVGSGGSTMTVAWSVVDGANLYNLQITITSSLTPTTRTIKLRTDLGSAASTLTIP